MIRAALFDIDGTLIDSNDLHVEVWGRVFAAAGHSVRPAAIHAQIGKGGDKLVPALLPDLPEREQEALSEAHGKLFKAEYLAHAKPFAQARALLERVHAAGVRVVLASSASREELDHYVDLLDVGDIVAAGTSIDDVADSKPAPDIFAVALEKAHCAPDEAVAVGDTPYDAAAAAKAGVGTIGLLSGGFAAQALRDAGAQAIYPDVAALLADFGRSALAR